MEACLQRSCLSQPCGSRLINGLSSFEVTVQRDPSAWRLRRGVAVSSVSCRSVSAQQQPCRVSHQPQGSDHRLLALHSQPHAVRRQHVVGSATLFSSSPSPKAAAGASLAAAAAAKGDGLAGLAEGTEQAEAEAEAEAATAAAAPAATAASATSASPPQQQEQQRQQDYEQKASAGDATSTGPQNDEDAPCGVSPWDTCGAATYPPSFPADAQAFAEGATARVVTIVGAGSTSPFEDTPWEEVMRHMGRRINWIDPGFQMLIFLDSETSSPSQDLTAALRDADVLLAVNVHADEAVRVLIPHMARVGTSAAFDSAPALVSETRLGGIAVNQLSLPARAAARAGVWPKGAEAIKTLELVNETWARESVDDVPFLILVMINAYVAPVPMLQSLRAKDLGTLRCMLGNCAPQIWACLKDDTCRSAISCLTSCGPTDQVCSYRCIVSYESAELEAFSLCILQKNKCLGLSAELRMRPEVPVLPEFRGQLLTHDAAEGIFIGWLGNGRDGSSSSGAGGGGGLPYSWRVVAGQNAAYDQFPCQYQIYYRGKARGSMWYDPVFQVKALDGRTVWRRRHYRVRRADTPGTFNLSVLDNGVISAEFWRIVDAAADLSWAFFHYSGTAAAAGQSYMGAVLVSKDGEWPGPEHEEQIAAALERSGIKRWELFPVSNGNCQGAPLGLPEDAPTPVPLV